MQAGHQHFPHLGTPVVPELARPSPQARAVQNSLAQKIFDTTMANPTVGMNERNSVFRRAALGLEGMRLTHAPNGGFSRGPSHTVIGASPDGLDASVRPFPTYFSGDVPKKWVGPTSDLTTPGNTVFREHDGKTRSGIGSMSVARMDAEIKLGEQKRQEHLRYNMLASGTPSTLNAYPAYTPIETKPLVSPQGRPVQAYVQPSPISMLQPQRQPSMLAQKQPTMLAQVRQPTMSAQVRQPTMLAQTQPPGAAPIPHPFPPYDPDFPDNDHEVEEEEAVIDFSFVNTTLANVKEYTNNNKPTVIVLVVFAVILIVLLIVIIVQAANMATFRKHLHAAYVTARRAKRVSY